MEQHIVGKPLQRIDAWAKATGRAEFGADVHLPDMVYCKGVYTEYVHAKLLAVHTEAAEARRRRGTGLGLLLQQAMTAFDPLRTIEAHFLESLREKCGLAAAEARRRAEAYLKRTGLTADVLHAWPHQLSGGMLQRCMIALTLSLEPSVIVADEPTTAQDACHQFKIVRLLAGLRQERALLVVSHDLAVVQALADDLLIMYEGRCVESGPAAAVLAAPEHACTRRLLDARRALSRPFLQLREGLA